MKTKFLTLSLGVAAASFLALGATAQVAAPSSPAPAIDMAGAPQASQMVYSPRLPSAGELTNVAAAQGLTIDKIVQTAGQMTVVYRSANGQTNTVAYMLLPAAGSTSAAPATDVGSPAVVGTTTPTTVVVASQPATRVVYVDAPAYGYDPYYYPSYYGPWYGPVALSVGWGFGFHDGGGRGGYHGDYHGGGFHGRH